MDQNIRLSNSDGPLFSIITVCFNSEQTIERTIESVINQSCQDFEYIIVDGKSNDNTLNIIEKYAKQYSFIRYVSEKDTGIYNAMNKGVLMAKGRYIGILNSNDYYEYKTLEYVKNHSGHSDYEVIYGMVKVVNTDGKIKKVELHHHDFMDENMIDHPACFVSKSIYDRYGLYSEDYKASSDLEFFLRIWKKNVVFTPVYEVLTNFTVGGVSSTEEAHLETFKVQYNYGIMSKKRYTILKIRYYIKRCFKGAFK